MAWWERREAPSRAVSLAGLFAGDVPAPDLGAGPELDTVIEELLRSGFPGMTGLTTVQTAARLRGYIDDVTTATPTARRSTRSSLSPTGAGVRSR